ncbi:major facilitator superfamily domain-containing protein [Hirsutella rhossiliensis]|uniref:Major facilitator superfamily domain-containing protein n=1 Tax=Hirsutella rhossiliensis TaxID=111463 RepID=A0A9P8SL05_9HYPO|nr:major facilitator superfamily domain-containing protein [Hirsutella rhossiliensis]KAH0966451.1 major facilitator superfamily domain-containing protein [Hirsutella rhossiliensis]
MAITSRDQVSSMTTALPVTTAEVESHPVPVSSKADEAGADRSQHGTLVVAFNEPFDASNPKQWPRRRKWAVTNVLSASGFNRILVSTIMAPALPIIASEFDMSSAEAAMALSIYVLATAFGPLFIGPLTERFLIAARFLAGFGASSIYALAGGVLGDVCAVIAAFNYGILYIVLTSFAHLWVSQYRMSVELSGMHYIACALGELVGAQIGGPLIDWSYRRKLARSPEHLPEFRVPLIFPGAIISCLGLFVYGWAAQYHVHWLAVDVGIFMSMFGMQLMGLPLKAYVMDSYPDHTGSALAASQFLESLTAFLFPLFAPSMYDALGYGWGNSTLAFAGLVFGVPTPLILWFFGARLRKRAQSSY